MSAADLETLPVSEPFVHLAEQAYDAMPVDFVIDEDTVREMVDRMKQASGWTPKDAHERRQLHRQSCYHIGLFLMWHQLN